MSNSGSPQLSNDQPRNPRTLVLCFDGTANQYDGDNTNVVKFFSLLKKDNFSDQPCYYQAGIGTYFQPGVVAPALQWCAKLLDEAVAWYLNEHVMDGYKFLMQNYRTGDKICLFGFSRGAYTARALAGMLLKVGLLPKDNQQQVPFAYKLYKSTDKQSATLSAGFKQTFSQDVTIDFVGVWDTVSSVGVVMGRTLPFTSSNTAINTFRHALSLDEHRAKFRPNLYHRPSPNAAGAKLDPEHGTPVLNYETTQQKRLSTLSSKLARLFHFGGKEPEPQEKESKRTSKHTANGQTQLKIKTDGTSEGNSTTETDLPPETDSPSETDVLEVWFSGCHSDVGGGAVTDATMVSLSEITLRWMVREVMASQCGIQFDNDALQRLNIPTEVFPPATSETAGSEELILDATDAIQPLHDELKLDPLWWILEVIPLSYAWQDAKGVWHKTWSIHFGKGRKITCPGPKFHVTVKERMAKASLKYKPKATWKTGTEQYVE